MTRIALVEDDADVRNSICLLLQRMGHEVEMHENGSAIVDNDGDFEPDVVLTDILMPGTDGMETIRSLVRKYPEVRIIAMSSGATGDNPGSLTRWARMVGAHDALSKPFTAEALESSLALVLEDANLAETPQSATEDQAIDQDPNHG